MAEQHHSGYQLPPPRPCTCGAEVGERHDADCEIARCRSTGAQLIQCGGQIHEHNGRSYGEHDGPCDPDVWRGHYPGTEEAVERGWFSRWGPPWIRCSADHPGAGPDLNRIYELAWDARTERYVDHV